MFWIYFDIACFAVIFFALYMMYRSSKKNGVAVLILLSFLIAGPVSAGEVTLSWEAPTTSADGTPLTDLAGFRFYKHIDDAYEKVGNDIQVGTLITSFPLPAGYYCFVGTAFDTSGNESEYTNEVCADMMPPSNYILKIVTGQGE